MRRLWWATASSFQCTNYPTDVEKITSHHEQKQGTDQVQRQELWSWESKHKYSKLKGNTMLVMLAHMHVSRQYEMPCYYQTSKLNLSPSHVENNYLTLGTETVLIKFKGEHCKIQKLKNGYSRLSWCETLCIFMDIISWLRTILWQLLSESKSKWQTLTP